jgi:hypothetical protein
LARRAELTFGLSPGLPDTFRLSLPPAEIEELSAIFFLGSVLWAVRRMARITSATAAGVGA